MLALPLFSLSQENSPYSRYGIGNLVPQGNLLNRSMGGISAGFADQNSINYVNPASYGHFSQSPDLALYLPPTIFDIGVEVTSRTLKSTSPAAKFTSNNFITSYLQAAFPLTSKKMAKNNMSWGINAGLIPVSKIDYKIQKDGRNTIDSLSTIYEGSGGLNKAFIGTGFRIKNFSIGFNAGYLFGKKDYGTRVIFINDSVNYLKSNSASKTGIGGFALDGGIQYSISLKKRAGKDSFPGTLKIGAYGSLQQKFNGSQDVLRETFSYNANGGTDHLDSVFENNIKGTLQLPATFGVGFTVERQHWLYGADFEMTNWDNYRFYGQKDLVQNSWIVKAGFQYYPAKLNSRKYGQFIKYRAGFSFGPDYIMAGKKLPQFTVSIGAGLPLKLKRAFYETQYSVMNVLLEYGNRGNNSNNIRENILRIGLGFSLSDIWFRRYKYQ
jgi:hypothetical protein